MNIVAESMARPDVPADVVDLLQRVDAYLVGYSPSCKEGPPKPWDRSWLLGKVREITLAKAKKGS